jgi:hypothetical protein
MAKKGFKPVNGFDKNRERASLAGKKSSTALPPELKEARLLNSNKVEELLYKYMNASLEELDAAKANPLTPMMELVVIKILEKAVKEGDHHRLEFLLSRTIGRIVDRVQIDARIQTKTLHDQIIDIIEADSGDK